MQLFMMFMVGIYVTLACVIFLGFFSKAVEVAMDEWIGLFLIAGASISFALFYPVLFGPVTDSYLLVELVKVSVMALLTVAVLALPLLLVSVQFAVTVGLSREGQTIVLNLLLIPTMYFVSLQLQKLILATGFKVWPVIPEFIL